YAVADLKAWADVGTRKSTSDPGTGTVLPAKRHAPIAYAGKERR
ncbi:DNA-binding protein, partial [Staphylococcus coagulans]|nr:DNA-binding protein [Staphylococcus coagulans]